MWGKDKTGPGGVPLEESMSPIFVTGDFALDSSPVDRISEVSVVDSSLGSVNIAQPMWDAWRSEIDALGGSSPLLHFDDAPRTRIDLSQTHPGGLPKLILGQPTLLSHLVREEGALRQAKIAAAAVVSKNTELRAMRGIDAIALGVGIAEWAFRNRKHTAPILLQRMHLRQFGKDFELKLLGTPFLNPILARALERQYQVALDAEAFVALASSTGTFEPQPIIERLRDLTRHVSGFEISPRIVVSTFADASEAMSDDAYDLTAPLLSALAGNSSARERLSRDRVDVQLMSQDERPPATDTLLLDADSEQEKVVAHIAAGNSIVVRTLPGTGVTQTVVNAIGALASLNKRALIVSARRSSLDAVRHRLSEIGLGGLAVSTLSARRDLIEAILRNERAIRPDLSEVDDALVRLRNVLLDYREALADRDPVLGVSVLDALTELSRLSLLPVPPSTQARLSRESIEALANTRQIAAGQLVRAARLGEFRFSAADSPWVGVAFTDAQQATIAHELARRLNNVEFPRVLERGEAVFSGTRLRPFESLGELWTYIRLVIDIRETLDKFTPAVFDRSLTELITAHEGRKSGMSGANRRRLKKLAHEYVRPGAHVSDMHGALTRIEYQRDVWQRFAAAGAVPEVPIGVDDLQASTQALLDDLAKLDAPLGRTDTPRSLTQLTIDDLKTTLAGLSAESEVLSNLQERSAVVNDLREQKLDALLLDLAERHVAETQVENELELAWWQSVLEGMLASKKALLNANTDILDRLEADFRLVDETHAGANSQSLAAKLAELWKIGLVDRADEANNLRDLLRREAVSASDVFRAAPNLAKAIAPMWICSPYEVHQIPDSVQFDTVILLDASATSVAENAGAIRRASSIAVFGDPVLDTPAPFELAMHEESLTTAPDELVLELRHGQSAFARFASILPMFTLSRSFRSAGEDLSGVINRRFYSGKIHAYPWAGTFLGSPSLRLHVVKNGMASPDAVTGLVESTDAEVEAVVELVLAHATARPSESLMVVTASAKHAARVEAAVLSAFARRQDVTEFILAEREEPFVVMTLEQSVALSRDRVIFSIGYGRTPHGRLLSDFGTLSQPGGERILAVALTRARRSLEIVSCFAPQDIDPARLSHGILALVDVLTEAQGHVLGEPKVDGHSEPMLVDLGRRLERRGIRVSLNHAGVIPLAATIDGKAVAIDTDEVLATGTLREALRLRPAALRQLGWHYARVHSFELFADPEGIADRVQNILSPVVVEHVEEVVAHTSSDALTAPVTALPPVTVPVAAAPENVTRPPLSAVPHASSVSVSESDVETAPLEIRSYRDEED